MGYDTFALNSCKTLANSRLTYNVKRDLFKYRLYTYRNVFIDNQSPYEQLHMV